MKRKRENTDFDIAVDTESQIDHSDDDGNDKIGFTLLGRVLNVLGTPSRQRPDTLGSLPPTSTGEHRASRLSAPPLGSQSRRTVSTRQFRPPRSPTLLSHSKSSKKSTSAPNPQSSNLSTSPAPHPDAPETDASSAGNQSDKTKGESEAVGVWDPKDWDEDEFDSDDEHMSLAVMMKLSNELSLLKSFLELYRKFNIHLGGKKHPFTQPNPSFPKLHHTYH